MQTPSTQVILYFKNLAGYPGAAGAHGRLRRSVGAAPAAASVMEDRSPFRSLFMRMNVLGPNAGPGPSRCLGSPARGDNDVWRRPLDRAQVSHSGQKRESMDSSSNEPRFTVNHHKLCHHLHTD
jgi:hypothetical protein